MSRRCHPFAVGLCVWLAATAALSGGIIAADGAELVRRVRVLSAEEMAGRATGTAGARAAADSIAGWFARAGLVPVPSLSGWFQDFPLSTDEPTAGTGRNVLGWLPGEGELAERVLVLGAHYDHLGLKLADDGETVVGVYHGAEDNASGVSVLVELAGRLAAGSEGERRSCLFAAFAGEEIGLLGSFWLVKHPVWSPDAADLMLNLDSVGRLRDDRLYVGGLGSSPVLRGLVADANAGHGLRLELSDSGWDASDHVAFNAAGIPVLFLFTGPHPQYHTVADRWDLVAGEGLSRVAAYAADLAGAARVRSDGFPYVARSDLPPRDPSIRGRDRAWLGTIPDFVEGVAGVRLAGVMPGGPAQESGLLAGDVLVELEGRAIGGLPDLTVALQDHGAGESVEVIVEREGERLSFLITLRRRPQ